MIDILVVEDDKPSGLILKKLLMKSGYNIMDVVETGEEAFRAIEIKKPDIILMDISLPGEIDGIETAEKITESERKYRNLYEFSQVGFFETDLINATVIMCNQRYCDLAGFSSVDEAIGHDILHLYVDPDDREEIKKIMFSQGFITEHIIRLRNRKTGKIFWGEFSARLNMERNIAEGSIIDITNLKSAEEQLTEKNEILQKAMDELDQLRYQQAEEFHQIEEWRDALVAGDREVLTELVGRFGLDPQQLNRLARLAAAEKEAGKPSKNGRALFRLLRQAFEGEAD